MLRFSRRGSSRCSRRTENAAQLSVQIVDLLFDREIGRSWPVGCICEVIGLLCVEPFHEPFTLEGTRSSNVDPTSPK